MSGPSLARRETHHAIHEAAFAEAEELTQLLRQRVRAGDTERGLALAGVLLEHWQTRTLRHAEAEETGWYRDLATEHPDLRDDIISLTRDHELLRLLAGEIQGILAARGMVAGIVERFEAMLLLNAIHSREEERRLFGDTHADATLSPIGASTESVDQRNTRSPMPLVVARPPLYARLIERLRERGVNPGDIQAEVLDPGGEPRLRVGYGDDYRQTLEHAFPRAGDEAAETALIDAICDTCAPAVQADYYHALDIPQMGGATRSGIHPLTFTIRNGKRDHDGRDT